MDGCTDGTWQHTGLKFFNCPDGMGIYYPLGYLRSDERYSDKVSTYDKDTLIKSPQMEIVEST